MKKTTGTLALFLLLSFLSCQDSKDESGTAPNLSEYRNVGMRIPAETGARWIEAYNRQNNISGRLGTDYAVGSAELHMSLSSVTSLVGVAFHYGFDESGEKHLIMIPVDESMSLWTAIEGRVYIDANSNKVITQATARSWADDFKAANPSGIWFHYFGRTVFDEILSLSSFATLTIMPALNDLDLSPQLLLIVGDGLSILGRTETETPVYDASYPCPKCEVN
jgi:hypothetical protein